MKRFRSDIFVLLAVLLMCVFIATAVFAAGFWQKKNNRISGTAGEALTTGDVVCILSTDSKVYKADADSSTLRPAIGVIGKGGANGAVVEIVLDGILAGQTSATPGARLFLSATAGAFTTNAAVSNPQPMGFVLPLTAGYNNSTVYYVNPVMVGYGNNGVGY